MINASPKKTGISWRFTLIMAWSAGLKTKRNETSRAQRNGGKRPNQAMQPIRPACGKAEEWIKNYETKNARFRQWWLSSVSLDVPHAVAFVATCSVIRWCSTSSELHLCICQRLQGCLHRSSESFRNTLQAWLQFFDHCADWQQVSHYVALIPQRLRHRISDIEGQLISIFRPRYTQTGFQTLSLESERPVEVASVNGAHRM